MHHLTTLAVAGSWLFMHTADYEERLAILERAVEDRLLVIHQLCLMGNHEHLVATVDHDRLGRTMQRINRNYAVTFNGAHGRRGRLYDGPYGSKRITEERHGLAAVSYVALNPEEVGLGSAETYRWSSYGSLIGLRPRLRFIDDEPLVDFFGGGELGRRRIARAVADTRHFRLQQTRSETRLRNLVRDEVPLRPIDEGAA
jgi:hypothetical protein